VVNKALTHDGNAELALHMALRHHKGGPPRGTHRQGLQEEPRRIDLAMAAIMAFDRAKKLVGRVVQFW
jgi:hypothetical protein